MAGFGDSLPNADGLVAEYQMFGNADDSTDNGFHGTFSNGATASARWISILSQTSVVSVADADALTPSNAITLMAWVNILYIDDYTIIGKEGSATDRSYYLRCTGSGYLEFRFVVSGDGTNFDEVTTPTSDYSIGVWTHVACTFNAGALPKIFVNGVDQNATRAGGGVQNCLKNNAAPLTFGRRRDGIIATTSYIGLIGPVLIYSRALTADEIMDDYAKGPPND